MDSAVLPYNFGQLNFRGYGGIEQFDLPGQRISRWASVSATTSPPSISASGARGSARE